MLYDFEMFVASKGVSWGAYVKSGYTKKNCFNQNNRALFGNSNDTKTAIETFGGSIPILLGLTLAPGYNYPCGRVFRTLQRNDEWYSRNCNMVFWGICRPMSM